MTKAMLSSAGPPSMSSMSTVLDATVVGLSWLLSPCGIWVFVCVLVIMLLFWLDYKLCEACLSLLDCFVYLIK